MHLHGRLRDPLCSPSCGSVGDFTDIQQDAEGNLAITSEMQCYNFSVRRLNGDWYAHVYPFDTKYFRKVHPAGALLFSGVHSHLMLLQYILINLPSAKTPIDDLPFLVIKSHCPDVKAGTYGCLTSCTPSNSTFNINDISGAHILCKSLYTLQMRDADLAQNGYLHLDRIKSWLSLSTGSYRPDKCNSNVCTWGA